MGLLHRLRGRPVLRQLPADVRAAVATLLQRTYASFNDCCGIGSESGRCPSLADYVRGPKATRAATAAAAW